MELFTQTSETFSQTLHWQIVQIFVEGLRILDLF